MIKLDLSGLVILITGASSGIGYTLANILHDYGATVIGVYNKHKIKDVLFDTYKCDISKEKDIKELFQYIKDKHEKLDVLVNGAAINLDCDFFDKTKEEFMKVLEVNLVGTFLMCKYASKIMNRGIIVNIASTDAFDTYSTISMDYAASKAGLVNLTKNLAQRLPNLKICGIAPNWVLTETVSKMDENYLKEELKRIGQNRLLKKEEVAIKIIEIIINDDIRSGEVVILDARCE